MKFTCPGYLFAVLMCCISLSACGEPGSAGPQEPAASQAPVTGGWHI